MPTSGEEAVPTEWPAPTTGGCKRKADSIEAPTTDSPVQDEKKYDIFSEESKLLLSKLVSQCMCGGWRICGGCSDIYKPVLIDSDSDSETDEKTSTETPTGTPRLCKRDCADDSKCISDYVRVLPCTVCKRMTDDGEVDFGWANIGWQERQDLISEENICPGCLAKNCQINCSVCNRKYG